MVRKRVVENTVNVVGELAERREALVVQERAGGQIGDAGNVVPEVFKRWE